MTFPYQKSMDTDYKQIISYSITLQLLSSSVSHAHYIAGLIFNFTFICFFCFATCSPVSECLLVSEDDIFGLLILPPHCEAELLMSPSA